MTAEEMFKNLGYTKRPDFNVYIVYTKPHPWLEYRVVFDTRQMIYYAQIFNPEIIQYDSIIFIDSKLHQAIAQQVKELGWIK